MQLLEGKVAIITGAGRGLGRASAIAMAGEGASVVILSRHTEQLMETSTLINNPRVLAVKADVSNEADVKNTVSQTIERFGRIDILMNNAAILGPICPLDEVKPQAWDRTFEINAKGAFMFAREVIPHMKKLGSGKIINVTSGFGEMVMPLFGVYSMTKAALIHMTRLLAEELAPDHIDTNGLDPGVMDTKMQEMIRDLGPKVVGEMVYTEFNSMYESGYLSHPAEVARLAVFLASPDSDGITGIVGSETEFREHGFTP